MIGEELKEDRRGPVANRPLHQMCLIQADFKHFPASKAKEFCQYRKVSSIM
jgi:hypothetical protein